MPWAESSLEQPQSSSAGDAFVAGRRRSRLAGHRQYRSGAPRRRGMGTLSLPVPFLVKVAGSTHFPVFFCQRWEKGPNILPAYESKTPWRDCEKASSRAALWRLVSPISTTPLNQGELLPVPTAPPPPFVSLRPSKETQKPSCRFLQRFRWNKYCLISLVLFV